MVEEPSATVSTVSRLRQCGRAGLGGWSSTHLTSTSPGRVWMRGMLVIRERGCRRRRLEGHAVRVDVVHNRQVDRQDRGELHAHELAHFVRCFTDAASLEQPLGAIGASEGADEDAADVKHAKEERRHRLIGPRAEI